MGGGAPHGGGKRQCLATGPGAEIEDLGDRIRDDAVRRDLEHAVEIRAGAPLALGDLEIAGVEPGAEGATIPVAAGEKPLMVVSSEPIMVPGVWGPYFGAMLPGVDHLPHTHDLGRNAFSRGP